MASVHLTREELCCRNNDLSNYSCTLHFAVSSPRLTCVPGGQEEPPALLPPQKIHPKKSSPLRAALPYR